MILYYTRVHYTDSAVTITNISKGRDPELLRRRTVFHALRPWTYRALIPSRGGVTVEK